jgi:hypothetical protein
MALMTILSERMRQTDEVQSFIDVSQDVETTTTELLSLLMNAPLDEGMMFAFNADTCTEIGKGLPDGGEGKDGPTLEQTRRAMAAQLTALLDSPLGVLVPMPVEKELPDDMIEVLALSDLDGWTVAYIEDGDWFEKSTGDCITVLKWMHLPPEEEQITKRPPTPQEGS